MRSISNINLSSGGGLGPDQAIFRIMNQTLVFNNLIATVSDERILATDAVLVYYADDSIVLNAGITTSWSTGVITFTADSAPTGSVVVNIYVIKPALANVWDSISASEVAYGSSSVKNYLDNLAANQVSYGSETVQSYLTNLAANQVSYSSGTVQSYLSNLASNQVSYSNGTVKDALDKLGVAWTIDFGTYNNGSYRSKAARVGNIIFFYFSGAKNLSVNTFTKVGTLPSACPKPSSTQTMNLQHGSAYATLGIYSNGNIEVNCNEANCYGMGTMMYTV